MTTQSITIPAKGGRPARHLTGTEAVATGFFMVIFGLAMLVFSLWPSEQSTKHRPYDK